MRAVEGAGPRTGADDPPLVVETRDRLDADRPGRQSLRRPRRQLRRGHHRPRPSGGRGRHPRPGRARSATCRPRRSARRASRSRRRSSAIAPAGLDRVLLGLSGSDANDTALKLARTLTGRHEVIAFSGGYFGRGSGVIGLNGKARDARSGRARRGRPLPALPVSVSLAARPGRRRPARRRSRSSGMRSRIRPPGSDRSRRSSSSRSRATAASSSHPTASWPGCASCATATAPSSSSTRSSAGFGRTGRTWAAEHWNVVPDLMTVGKGIGGGLAVSAVVGRPGVHGPLGAGHAHLDVHGQRGQPGRRAGGHRRLARRGPRGALRDGRGASCSSSSGRRWPTTPHVGEVRGLGLFVGIEIVADRDDRDARSGSHRRDPACRVRAGRAARLGRPPRERHQALPAADHRRAGCSTPRSS